MKKKELANRIQEGFFDLAPEDLFDKIVEATEESHENVVVDISERKKAGRSHSISGYQILRRIAVIAILIGLGAGIFGVQKGESTFVLAMDVNPSIQLELKSDYYVKKIVGLNEDGEDIIKKLQWQQNSSIEQTMEMLTEKLVSEGYLKENDGILITVNKREEKQEYSELETVLNREIEKDVLKWGIHGVKVVFQTVDKEIEQPGKEILKEQLVEKYHLEQKEMDSMNIRDMIDYVENEKSDNTILKSAVNKEEKKEVQEPPISSDDIGSKPPVATAGQDLSKEKKQSSESKDKKGTQTATQESGKSIQENKNNQSTDKGKEQKSTTDTDSKSSQEKAVPTGSSKNVKETPQPTNGGNSNNPKNTPQPDTGKKQENPPGAGNENNQGKWQESGGWYNEEKRPKPGNPNNPGRWPVFYDDKQQKGWWESDDWYSPGKWQEPNSRGRHY